MKKIILLLLAFISFNSFSQVSIKKSDNTTNQSLRRQILLLTRQVNKMDSLYAAIKTNSNVITSKTIGVSSTTIAVTTTPYSVGDNLAGIITVTNTSRTSGGSSEIKSFSLWDKANQKVSITVLFWNASPSAGTYTDNSAMVVTGDEPKFLGKIEISSADYTTIGANAIATIPVNLKIKPTTGTSIFCTYLVSGSPTFATNGLVSTITTEQD